MFFKKHHSIMTQEQILLEYHNLMISHIQAIEVSGYYTAQRIRLMQELIPLQKEAVEMEISHDLPNEEIQNKIIEFKRMQAKIDASMELLKQMDRLTEKAERKSNEAKKRLELFCKRHGVEI